MWQTVPNRSVKGTIWYDFVRLLLHMWLIFREKTIDDENVKLDLDGLEEFFCVDAVPKKTTPSVSTLFQLCEALFEQ